MQINGIAFLYVVCVCVCVCLSMCKYGVWVCTVCTVCGEHETGYRVSDSRDVARPLRRVAHLLTFPQSLKQMKLAKRNQLAFHPNEIIYLMQLSQSPAQMGQLF